MRKMVVLTFIAGTATLSACGPRTQQSADNAMESTGTAVEDTAGTVGNATANAFDAAKEAVTPTPTAKEFVDKAAQGDAFEIAAARLAKAKAQSADVKAFASEMIQAHTGSTARIRAAASKATTPITPDSTLPASLQDRLDALKLKTGKDFDDAYAADQVEAHEDALALMKLYADRGDVVPLKAVAADLIPIIQNHLDMARTLDKSQDRKDDASQ